MNDEKRDETTTPPSQAPGESGDREARQEAEDAILPGAGDEEEDGEAGDALTPNSDAQRRASEHAKDADRAE